MLVVSGEALELGLDVTKRRVVTGKEVAAEVEVEMETPPAGYGHQLKLDVEVDITPPTAGIAWRGNTVVYAIVQGTIATTKHKGSRGMALSKDTPTNRYSCAPAKSLGFSDCDSALHSECGKVAHWFIERKSCSQECGTANNVE